MEEEDAHIAAQRIVSVLEGLSVEDKLRMLQGAIYYVVVKQPNPDAWLEAFQANLIERWPEFQAMVNYLHRRH